jgi:hypothetical protein
MFNFPRAKRSVRMPTKPEHDRAQAAREMPLWREAEATGTDRFVSCRTMHQVRLKILKRLSDRLREEMSPSPQG